MRQQTRHDAQSTSMFRLRKDVRNVKPEQHETRAAYAKFKFDVKSQDHK